MDGLLYIILVTCPYRQQAIQMRYHFSTLEARKYDGTYLAIPGIMKFATF